MALLDIIKKRRSIRKYLDKAVEREKINLCLEAARLAPSAINGQPWKFIVVDEPELKKKLCEAAFRGVFAFNTWAKAAPGLVVVVVNNSPVSQIINTLRNSIPYLIDIGITTEHFVLQAEELGLGTCWMAGLDEKATRKVLGIPLGKKVAAIIALGYPDLTEEKRSRPRKKLEEMASFNGWNGE
jgi:nitroreductase